MHRRDGPAWIGFVASFPLIGVARGSWRSARNRLQLLGVIGFSAIALSAAAVAPTAATILVIVGLLLHAAWDVWHHVRDVVVARPYAEFCAVLDVAVAIALAVGVSPILPI